MSSPDTLELCPGCKGMVPRDTMSFCPVCNRLFCCYCIEGDAIEHLRYPAEQNVGSGPVRIPQEIK